MIFAEKGLPVILRPFRGSLDVKWGVWRTFKVKKRETQNFLPPPNLKCQRYNTLKGKQLTLLPYPRSIHSSSTFSMNLETLSFNETLFSKIFPAILRINDSIFAELDSAPSLSPAPPLCFTEPV